jgi:hypothetical protein
MRFVWVSLFVLLMSGCQDPLPSRLFGCPCADGFTCVDGLCYRPCTYDHQCPVGHQCENLSCLPDDLVDYEKKEKCSASCPGQECQLGPSGPVCSSCTDGQDNDGDGLTDCLDEECITDTTNCPCVRYVSSQSSVSLPHGMTWDSAFGSVNDAVDSAGYMVATYPTVLSCDVWVEEGSYFIYESGSSNTVMLHKGVTVFGGFPRQGNLGNRDFVAHESVLDGRAGEGSESRVNYVVTGATGAVLDGLVIQESGASGMINQAASPMVRNCAFKDNINGHKGSGVRNENSTVVFENCLFSNNHVNGSLSHGGAMYNDGGEVSIIDCTFEENSAATGISGGSGGAVSNYDEADVTITGCTFRGNTAEDGGAIDNSNALVVVDNCLFYDNASSDTNCASIKNYKSDAKVISSYFWDNVAGQLGVAGIQTTHGSVEVDSCLFSNNFGAAVSLYEAEGDFFSTAFSNNTTGMKAPLECSKSNMNVDSCLFSGNAGGSLGAALSASDCDSSSRVSGSYFIGNGVVSPTGGAALSLRDSGMTVENSVFYDNRGGLGGAIQNSGSFPVYVNCTVVNNKAEFGGAMSNSDSFPELINSIFWDNSSTSGYFDMFAGEYYSHINNCIVQDPEYAGQDNTISSNPKLVGIVASGTLDSVTCNSGALVTVLADNQASWGTDEYWGYIVDFPALGVSGYIAPHAPDSLTLWGNYTDKISAGASYSIVDLRLKSGSPAIDSGTDIKAPDADVLGHEHIDITGQGAPGSTVDIGAYEYGYQ